MRTIEYTDGKLILHDNGGLTAIGEYAHKTMYRLWALQRKGIEINEKLFDGMIDCKIIL